MSDAETTPDEGSEQDTDPTPAADPAEGISDEQRANTPGRSPSATTMRCAAARSCTCRSMPPSRGR